MVRTKGAAATQANYQAAIGTVPGKYKSGIDRTQGWQADAIAGEDLYGQAVQEAVADRRRAKGLQRVSDSEWKAAAGGKGAERIGRGMSASLPKYGAAMGEVLQVIESVSIGERTTDPDTNIDNRVKPIARALHDWKRTR